MTADHTPERLSAFPDAGMPVEHVLDRDGYVWRVVRDGGMATRAHYAGLISIGISTLEHQCGPLLDLAAHLADVEARLAAVEAEATGAGCMCRGAHYVCVKHRVTAALHPGQGSPR